MLHKVFFLLILSLQITQLPLLSSPSGQEQTQKETSFFSGQTPILPHYIIVSTQRNGREIPVFFSSRFQREKIGSKKGPARFTTLISFQLKYEFSLKHTYKRLSPTKSRNTKVSLTDSKGKKLRWKTSERNCLRHTTVMQSPLI